METTFEQSKYQFRFGANPSRGQSNRVYFYLNALSPFAPTTLLWSRETDSAVPSRVSLLNLHTQAESVAYSRQRDVYAFRDGLKGDSPAAYLSFEGSP